MLGKNLPMTQHEVARELGISQARVMQLENSAKRKLLRNPNAVALLKLVRFYPAAVSGPKPTK